MLSPPDKPRRLPLGRNRCLRSRKKKMRSAMTCKTPRLSPRDLSPEARLCKNGFHVYSNKSWGSSWTSLGSLGLHLEISGESLVLPGALSGGPWGLWDCTWRSLGESLGLPGALSGGPWAPWGSWSQGKHVEQKNI